MQSSLVIIAVFIIGEIAATIDYQCWNLKSENEIREKYLNNINKLRTTIPNKQLMGKNNKPFPPGKNVYKLNWDCLLEEEAQKVVDQCKEGVMAPGDVSTVLKKVPLTTCNPMPLFKTTVDGWWNVIQNETATTTPVNSDALQSFATLAHASATRVGCAQKNCNGDLYMVCVVYDKAPANGQPIYEKGQGCSTHADCKTYEESRCNANQKICIAGYIDPTKTTVAPPAPATTTTKAPAGGDPTTTTTTATTTTTTTPLYPGGNTMCPNLTDTSSDTVRQKFLTLHNQCRSTAAKGGLRMSNGRTSNPASRMIKLGYLCDLEKSAYDAAKTCSESSSNPANADEIRKKISGNVDILTAAEQATQQWSDEIKTGYMDMTSGSRNQYRDELKIPNFAQMIWDDHRSIGCAAVKCTGFINVVCHYSPKVFAPGMTIYKVGAAPCRRCSEVPAKCDADGTLCTI